MKRPILTLLPALLLSACSMMTDDRSDCPTCYNPLHVTLRYDYNTERADLFNDQAEQATVYVVDALTRRVVDQQTARNTDTDRPLKNRSFAFNFEELAEGDYLLYATAHSRARTDGSLIRRTLSVSAPTLTEGDDIGQLITTLPRNAAAADATASVADALIDTLWQQLTPQAVHVEPYTATSDTVGLMRLTKNLSIVLLQTQNPAALSAADYDVAITVPDGCTFGPDASLLDDQPLTYTPYAAWTTTADGPAATDSTSATDSPAAAITATAHYDLSFGRLMAHPDDARRNARLTITHRETQQTVLDIDLVRYLALARSAAGLAYSVQEFLDREHDYHLDVVLVGTEWRYITISINVLSWSLRIQNEKL